MLFHTYGQARVFLGMLYAGLMIGACYSVLGLCARLMRAGKALRAALDALLGMLTALILIATMVETNYGEMRLYTILGASCGLVIYRLTLHPCAMAAARAVARVFRWIQKRANSAAWLKKVLR